MGYTVFHQMADKPSELSAATLTTAENNVREENDDDEDDDDDEEEHAIQLANVANAAPRNYEAHVAAVQALRSCGALVELRESRDLFSHEFPLTAEMWSEWIQDEVAAQGSTKSAKLSIAKLYSRAVADYYSPTLWVERISHEMDMQEQGIVDTERVRHVYEAGLAVAGYDIRHAGKLWELCYAFESKLLTSSPPASSSSSPTSSSSTTITTTTTPLVDYVQGLLQRQMNIPMDGSEEVMQELEIQMEQSNTRESTTSIRQFRRSHAQALSRRHAREQWEDMTKSAKLEDKEHRWLQYLDFENRSTSIDQVVVALYERALNECCLSPRIWTDYCNFVARMAPIDHEHLANVRYRAIRNITYLGELWSGHMRSCERNLTGGYVNKEWAKNMKKNTKKKGGGTGPTCIELVNNVLERALGNRFASDLDYSRLWLSYLHALRRLEPSNVDEAMVRAKTFMKKTYGPDTMAMLPLLIFEANTTVLWKDAKVVYEKIVAMKPSAWSSWTVYIQRANRDGGTSKEEEISELYRRAASQVTDHCDLVMDAYMQHCAIHVVTGLEQEEHVFVARANRLNEIAMADAKARARWKLDATIAAQKETKNRKAAGKKLQTTKQPKQERTSAVSKKRSRDATDDASSDQPPRKVARDSGLNSSSSSSSSSSSCSSSSSSSSSSEHTQQNKTSTATNDIPPSSFLYFVGVPKEKSITDLKQDFDAHGVVKDVIFALNKQGAPFGRGLLEYATIEMASSALTSFQKDPVIMGERRVHFTFSNVDRAAVTKRNAQVQKKILVTQKKERKARISFVPRGLKRK